MSSGQHVVRDFRETVDVRAPVDELAGQGLGRDVLQRAHKEAGSRQPLLRWQLGVPRDAEIQQLDAVRARVVHDVLGFQIAMDDTGRVCGAERIGQLAHERDGIRGGERALAV